MEILLMAGLGLFQTIVTQVAKKYGASVWTLYLAFAILSALIYQAFVFFVPEAIQTSISAFIMGTLGSASIIYGFIVKKIEK